jgi:hypothetical protein
LSSSSVTLKVSFINVDAAKFKTSFNDAKEFNRALKAGEELKYAPVIEEKEEEAKPKKEEEKKEN